MRNVRPVLILTLIMFLALGMLSCSKPSPSAPESPIQNESPQRVVALSSSLAEIWLLAGGTLVGTTSDTLERDFAGLSDNVAVIGTVKEPVLEAILDLKPDFVILSADITGHTALEQVLKDANIKCHFAHVETLAEYLDTLEMFCGLTGNSELLEKNGTDVQAQIKRLTDEYVLPSPPPTYLLMRVHSSGGKVIADDHVACDILSELGAVNIAAREQSLLSDLSLEAILESDPDYIFVVTMGDEDAALKTLEQMFTLQPAWERLSAAQNDRVHVLPKELFHYKPNAKWGEAYEAVIELLEP